MKIQFHLVESVGDRFKLHYSRNNNAREIILCDAWNNPILETLSLIDVMNQITFLLPGRTFHCFEIETQISILNDIQDNSQINFEPVQLPFFQRQQPKENTMIDLERLADVLGYDVIEWDDENQCYSGFGLFDPFNRRRDSVSHFIAHDDDELASIAKRELGE